MDDKESNNKGHKMLVFVLALFLSLGISIGIVMEDVFDIDIVRTNARGRNDFMEDISLLNTLINDMIPREPGMETYILHECNCSNCDPVIYIYYNCTPDEWNNRDIKERGYLEITPWVPEWNGITLVQRMRYY